MTPLTASPTRRFTYSPSHPAMAHDYIPRRDADFLNWSASFRNLIVASPASYGLTAAQASEYANLQDAYAAAYTTATNPSTATRPSIAAKNTARRSLEAYTRQLARLIQATSGVTATQKSELGLTVRDARSSHVPKPDERPRIFAKLLYGSTVRVRLRSLHSPRRGKPAGVAGAVVLTYVGDRPPDDLSKWRMTPTTKPTLEMTFTDVVPGSQVWFAAYWFNPRMERGPVCEPDSVHVACPTLLLADARLRLAA